MRAGDKHKTRDGLIFLLRFAHGMTYADLARAFGLSTAWVMCICRRQARRSLEAAHRIPPVQPAWWRRLRVAGSVPSFDQWFGVDWRGRKTLVDAMVDRHGD